MSIQKDKETEIPLTFSLDTNETPEAGLQNRAENPAGKKDECGGILVVAGTDVITKKEDSYGEWKIMRTGA